MADKRKVLFTYGMTNDYQLIITDATEEAIKKWCVQYVTDRENGVRNESFYSLKAQFYVMELLDSQTEPDRDAIELIGYDEVYDYANFKSEKMHVCSRLNLIGKLEEPTIDEVVGFLERHKGKGKKLSVMGTSFFYVYESDDEKMIILDEEDFTEEQRYAKLKLLDGKKICAPLGIDVAKVEWSLLEIHLWKLLLQYMDMFKVSLVNRDEPDWATVKKVQDKIIEVFEEAGVKFNV